MKKKSDLCDLVAERAAASNEAKKVSRTFLQELDGQTKLISMKEAQVDRFKAERLAFFKQCQLDQIEVPIVGGKNLQDFSLDVY